MVDIRTNFVEESARGPLGGDFINIDGIFGKKKSKKVKSKKVKAPKPEAFKNPDISIGSPKRAGLAPTSTEPASSIKNNLSKSKVVTPKSDVATELAENRAAQADATRATAAIGLYVDIQNANSAYDAVEGEARLNIYSAQLGADDAISRGKQRAFNQESAGRSKGQSALVSLAAQGLDIGNAGAKRVQDSQEAVGVYKGLLEEINASREALGFDLEVVQLEYKIDQAEVQKDSAIQNAFLNRGAQFATSFF